MQKPTDKSIIEHLQSGDTERQEQAFRVIYRQYYGLIESLVIRNSGDKEDAADVFQDGILVLFNKAKKKDFVLRHRLKSYLYAICRNLWLMRLRKTKGVDLEPDEKMEKLEIEEGAFKTLEMTERKKLIKKLVRSLGEECQKIIELYYYRKMRLAQVKEAMELASEQVAKTEKAGA